jgi:hypothetical protein
MFNWGGNLRGTMGGYNPSADIAAALMLARQRLATAPTFSAAAPPTGLPSIGRSAPDISALRAPLVHAPPALPNPADTVPGDNTGGPAHPMLLPGPNEGGTSIGTGLGQGDDMGMAGLGFSNDDALGNAIGMATGIGGGPSTGEMGAGYSGAGTAGGSDGGQGVGDSSGGLGGSDGTGGQGDSGGGMGGTGSLSTGGYIPVHAGTSIVNALAIIGRHFGVSPGHLATLLQHLRS